MKKRYIFIVFAICFGLFLTAGALHVSARQSQPPVMVSTAVLPNSGLEKVLEPDCLFIDPRMIDFPRECRNKSGAGRNGLTLYNTELEDLVVYVENAKGQPAVNALVMAGTLLGFATDYGYTGPDGYVTLNLPAGNYSVIAASTDDHFYLNQYPVIFPGSITLSAVGTPEVTLTAKKRDGSPLDQAQVGINITGGYANMWMYASLGYVDASGEMIFNVTSDIYDILVADTVNYYLLYKADQDFSKPSSVLDFDMSTQPSAELVVGHPDDSLSDLTVCTYEHNLFCPSYKDMVNNGRLVVSTELGYGPIQDIHRDDIGGDHWKYQFYLDIDQYTFFSPGEVITFSVGGDLSVIGRTEDAYVGDYIQLSEYPVDSFGSTLTHIYTDSLDYSDHQSVYPEIQLTDPVGAVTYLNSMRYRLPVFSPIGTYDMHFEWDTGPYQGLLTADSQFEVLPQQTSAVVPLEGGTLYSPRDDTLFEFPPGTFTDTVIITHTVRYTEIPAYAPLVGIGHFFDVTAVYSDTGLPAQPTKPYTITIGYEDWQRGVVIEDSLVLYNWDGLEWMQESTSQVDLINNHLVTTPNHFSIWGVLGETNRVFLAVINKK